MTFLLHTAPIMFDLVAMICKIVVASFIVCLFLLSMAVHPNTGDDVTAITVWGIWPGILKKPIWAQHHFLKPVQIRISSNQCFSTTFHFSSSKKIGISSFVQLHPVVVMVCVQRVHAMGQSTVLSSLSSKQIAMLTTINGLSVNSCLNGHEMQLDSQRSCFFSL